MAVDNPFEITYGSLAVGGASDTYQLHGPYVIDKTFQRLRIVFDVVVVATSYANLQSLSDTLEDAFRKRDQTLVIELDKIANPGTSKWTYTFGSHATNDGILNSLATISKTGDADSDRGYSRAYTITIEGDVPADDATTGLRDLVWEVSYEPGRQRVISMTGTYTAYGGSSATTKYQAAAGADNEASVFLDALSGSAAYELVEERYNPDRNDHLVEFSRQYVELLVNQSAGNINNTDIRDHSLRFVELINQPGDSAPDLNRFRRVVGSYDCAIDIDQTTDLQTTFTNTVRPHLIALFETEFSPAVFCVEDSRVGYDESTKRMSVALQLMYQPSGGTDVVEVTETVAYQERRVLDRTPVHERSGLAAYVDPGWDTLERVSTRVVTAIGVFAPNLRLGNRPARSGWNVVANTSQVQPIWYGDGTSNDQIQATILTETVVESFNTRPGGRGGNFTPGGNRAPIWLRGRGGVGTSSSPRYG